MLQLDEYTPEEKSAVEELKRRVRHKCTERLRQDETLWYRFLKARNFNMKQSEAMLLKHISDRKLYEIEKILEKNTLPESLKTYLPISFVGYDKEGSVVRYTCFGGDIRGLAVTYEYKTMMQYAMEYLERDMERMTEQSIKRGKQVSKTVFIMDMEKMTMSHVTYKKGLEMLLQFAKFYQDNYPERIKSIIIINAAMCFTIGYSIIKHCLASELIRKFSIFGKTGWKEELLKIIEADELPAFLGGNLTDPDGNPLCHSIITHSKKVPEELYMKNWKKSISEEEDAIKLCVTPFSTSRILFYICEPNSYMEWEFEVKQKDIFFGLYFKDVTKDEPETEELIPKQKVDSDVATEKGTYYCEQQGEYIIIFDNSHSWLHSKEIYYRVRITKPRENESMSL